MGFVLRMQGVGGAAVSPEVPVDLLLHLDSQVSLKIPEYTRLISTHRVIIILIMTDLLMAELVYLTI